MPSFSFWKASKQDEPKALCSNDDTGTQETCAVMPTTDRKPALVTGNEESGTFSFDDLLNMEAEQNGGSEREGNDTTGSSNQPKTELEMCLLEEKHQAGHVVEKKMELPMPKAGADLVQHESSEAMSTQRLLVGKGEPLADVRSEPSRSATSARDSPSGWDQDSGVYLSEGEGSPPQSRPTSYAPTDDVTLVKASVANAKHSLSKGYSNTPQRIDRLRRPAELNLSTTTSSNTTRPRSELEKRFDLIRNSKTQSKAALRSPTELLHDRLNMSPKKERHETRLHQFVPPKLIEGGCILPGPGVSPIKFTSTSVRARTEANGRPAWWCKVDRLVVFDGIESKNNGELEICARTSKGLSIARRQGDFETIIIPMNCAHCQDMLNRHEWKYEMQVCKRSVCWDCKERCKWEFEVERVSIESRQGLTSKADASRHRADSVLQDDQVREEDLMRKVGIEQGRVKSPIELIKGIEERLEGDGVGC
ncbi:hypothetical protein ACN47E_003968 [Coniothyrium glycines]